MSHLVQNAVGVIVLTCLVCSPWGIISQPIHPAIAGLAQALRPTATAPLGQKLNAHDLFAALISAALTSGFVGMLLSILGTFVTAAVPGGTMAAVFVSGLVSLLKTLLAMYAGRTPPPPVTMATPFTGAEPTRFQ